MKLHVRTSITSNTGKCYETLAEAISRVTQAQEDFLTPIGLHTTCKTTQHNLRSWFSHMYVDKYTGRMIQRHRVPDGKTPRELIAIYDYIETLKEYNLTITGDCEIHVSWTIG